MLSATVPPSRDLRLALWASALTQCACALILGGRLHHDEIHQYLEQAHRLAYGFGSVPHEYLSGMRNWLAPGVLAGLFLLLRALGLSDARILLGLCHLLVGFLSLRSIASIYELTLHATGSRPRAKLSALALALWVPSANLAFRTLGEGFTVVTLMAALAALCPPSGAPLCDRRAFSAGLWVGTGFVLRYAAGLYALPLALWLAAQGRWRPLGVFCAGVLVPFAGLGALDALTWGAPFHSVRAYADYNLLRGRARLDYGAQAPWFYALCALGLFPMGLFALGPWTHFRRALLPLSATGFYLLVMSLVAHKEARFFLPVVPPLIAAVVIASGCVSPLRERLSLGLLATHSAAALCVMLHFNVCQGSEARAALWIGRRPDLGAVASLSTYHPGYILLRQNVRVFYDPRANTRSALLALGSRWIQAPRGSFYVYGTSMSSEARSALARAGFSSVHTQGRVEVWARR